MRKLFSLFAAMLMALAVSAQTDFAAPGYKCAADDATLDGTALGLDGKLYLDTEKTPHQITFNDISQSYTAIAKWNITANRGCYVSVAMEMGTGIPNTSNKHKFIVKIFDSQNAECGSLSQTSDQTGASTDEKTAVEAFDGTILIPSAGEYRVEIHLNRDWGKGTIRNVVLTYAADAPSEIIEVSAVELDAEELTLDVHETAFLHATVIPDNATNPLVTWKSSDESVATVTDGAVKCIAAGNANITATAGEKSAVCAITVSDAIPSTDFAEPYFLKGTKAELEGNIFVSEADSLHYRDKSVCGTATWKLHVEKAGYIGTTVNFKTGSSSGTKFKIQIIDSEENIVGEDSLDYYNKAGDKAMPHEILIPAAGDYTIKLLNNQSWSSGKIKGLTLTYLYGLPKTIYCKMEQSWWTGGSAGIAAYAWGEGVDPNAAWPGVRMEAVEGQAGLWSIELPGQYTSVVFTRVNPSDEGDFYWGAKTEDLVIPTDDKDLFTITTATECWDPSKVQGEWSKYVAPEPEVPAKFYITGSGDALGNWNPAAIKSTEDTYTLNLAAGSYRMKVTVDGTWATGKGIDDLTTRAAGLQDINGNIGFILEEAGQVQVTYTNSEFKLEGNFSNTPIYKTYMATGEGWAGDDESSAVWNNEAKTITVNLVKGKQAQWQAQVWYKDIVAKADKLYDINLKLTSTKAMGGVIVKWQNAENIFIEEGISLEAGVAYSLSKLNQAGKAGGDGMLIFDFGYAAEGTVVTISEISIVEKDIPEPEPVVGCDWENIDWVSGSNNKLKVCKEGTQPSVVNVQKPGWAAESGIYMTFPSAAWGEISLPAGKYATEGAGMVIYLSAFELKYNEIKVNCSSTDYTFTVYNADAPDAVYTVVGSSEVAFGTSWDLNNADNKMALEEGLYKWEKTELSLAAGEITFKVAKNHSWDEAWPASNYVLNIPSEGLYTISITFNESTKEVNATVTKTGEAVVLPVIKLHGNFDSEWKDTDPFAEAGDKKSASLTVALEKGNYQFGLKKDGNWYANGAAFTRENPFAVIENNTDVNMTLAVDKDGDYTFTWTFATNTLDVDYPGCHWNELAWLGSTDATYANQFKVCVGDPTPNVVNIQKPGFASEIGIYLEFPSAVWDKSKFSLPESKYAIQGAGMVIYLSAFSAKETEVTIGCNNKDFIFTVYNAKGTDTPTSIDNTVVETKAVKYIRNGQLFIEMDGKVYNIVGARVK